MTQEEKLKEIKEKLDDVAEHQERMLAALEAFEQLTPALVLVIVSVTVALLGQLSDTVRHVTLAIGFFALLLSCYILHKSTAAIRAAFEKK